MTRPIEDTVAQLCVDLHYKASEYGEAVRNRAQADVAYRTARAQRILRARAEGVKHISEAELIADADEVIAQLRLDHLVAEGICDALVRSMMSLRQRIEFGRSRLASERQADALMATSREVP